MKTTASWASESSEINEQSWLPKAGFAIYWAKQYFSYIKPSWLPFNHWFLKIVVTKIDKNVARILNPISLASWKQEFIDIIWENNWPKILENPYWEQFLFKICDKTQNKEDIPHDVKKVQLLDRRFKYSPELKYPFELIWDLIIMEKNLSFCKAFSLDKQKTSILSKEWTYLYDTEMWENIINSLDELPSKNKMCLIWDRLVNWNEDTKKFETVRAWWIEFIWVSEVKKWVYAMKLGGKIVSFSASKYNPKEPACVIINNNFFLVEYSEVWKEIRINLNDWNYIIDLTKNVTIWWYLFYKFKNFDSYTDWKNVYKFLVDETWNIKTVDYRDKKCPILDDKDGLWRSKFFQNENNSWVKICVFENWKVEEIYLIKNQLESSEQKDDLVENEFAKDNENKSDPEDKSEKEKIEEQIIKKPEYIRLDIPNNLCLVNIEVVHWIVCLASDISNTSRYQFFRINPDGTLTKVFTDNYKIEISDSEVILTNRMTNFNCSSRNTDNKYKLVRRPGTLSIFEPILMNGKECLVAEWKKKWEVIYISIDKEYSIKEEEVEVDQKTFLPANKFEIEWEIFYQNKDGKINVLNNFYNLWNSHGKIASDPNDAIIEVWVFKILILKNDQEELFWYVLGSKEKNKILIEIEYWIQKSNDVFWRYRGVIKTNVWWQDKVCRYDYQIMNALWVLNISENWDSDLAYVNKKDEKWEFEWEEFMCEWKAVQVAEILSDEYVKDSEGNTYFRKDLWKDLVKIDLFDGKIGFWGRYPYCTAHYNNDYWYSLLIKEDKLIPISDEFKDFYLLADNKNECRLNGKKLNLVNAWDSKNNRVVSFKKVWKKLEILKIWEYEVCNEGFWSFIFYSKNSEPFIFNDSIYLNTVKIVSNSENKDGIILDKQFGLKDKRWSIILDVETWEEFVCAVYIINGEKYCVDLRKAWFKISYGNNWEFLFNGISKDEYDKSLIDEIYFAYKPKDIAKTTKDVEQKVSASINTLIQ